MASRQGKVVDLRPWVLAAVAAISPTDPTTALRGGAVVCAVLLLTAIGHWRPGAPDLLAIALTLLAVLSVAWALDPGSTVLSATNQVAVLFIFLCTRAVIRTSNDLSIIAVGYVFGCLYAVYVVLTQNGVSNFAPELADVRYGASGVNLNYLAYCLITGVVVSFLLWGHRFLRLLLLLAAVAMADVSWLAGSRGAALAALCLPLWLLTFRLGPSRAFRILGLIVWTCAATISVGLMDSLLRRVEGETVRATGDLAGRLTTWPIARRIFEDNPIIGVGAGGFARLNPYGIGAHNVILEVGVGLGLAGLLLFIATVYVALISCTSEIETRRRCLLVGSLVVCWTPIYLSGHWDLSPAAWLVLGLFSRLSLVAAPHQTERLGWLPRPAARPGEP